MTSTSLTLAQVVAAASSQSPFSLLTDQQQTQLFSKSKILQCKLGQRILRPDAIPEFIYLVIDGKMRLLAEIDGEAKSLDTRGSGQLIGWISLLRGTPTEWVTASENSTILSIHSQSFIDLLLANQSFLSWFSSLNNQHEFQTVVQKYVLGSSKHNEGWKTNLADFISNYKDHVTFSVSPGEPVVFPNHYKQDLVWLLSSSGVPGKSVGDVVHQQEVFPIRQGFKLPYRIIGFNSSLPVPVKSVSSSIPKQSSMDFEETPGVSLHTLGILEEDNLSIDQKFPIVTGRSRLDQALAVTEMVALYNSVPFRRDLIAKVVESQFRRDKDLSIEMMAGLQELLGINCQLADVTTDFLSSIETPVIFMLDDIPVVLFSNKSNFCLLGHPKKGLQKISLPKLQSMIGEQLRFAIPRKVGTTPTSRFGWNWFTPLLGKYKKALLLVFGASLLAQLFGLAIPLLIQQIIDKVLTQGNLSTLNVLGSLMIVLALFQGILSALRTYIFVDTTDRMDLTLGTAVIDRLLALPLTYFEKRPVGELSQRLGELNTIRGFLTGTALVSVLNIIFALLYLVVMIVYSPFLTAIALSTLPLYVLLVFGVAPIYKTLIRKRAVAAASTQSHLIEVLSGIQTVKAQHFELTARWKWQDRYRHFVTEGFKAVALGASSGEIGGFLNQVSGLLVLWMGMGLVLKGELTLGMLIAFRIISGNVTGPLLQLSGLYQGFQKVQLSMERLSDILDQNPELSREEDIDQISMPTVHGNIRFENVRFRFGKTGPYQVDDVSLSIPAGSFVGIVGQSGSGKSTLTKLIPKLYEVNSGRVFVDDYDIAKVNLSSLRRQIGIVPQDSLLFEGTVAENIALNDPQASNDAIIEAAKIACAHDFIMSLSQGYATPLAERGSNLSGGQRQRLAIARTILSNPQLLVMDEATSALDYNTERQLCLNLQEWAGGKTVLFITHRLSSIRSSDMILVMHEGRLVEQGTHADLLEANERYATLYSQQNNAG